MNDTRNMDRESKKEERESVPTDDGSGVFRHPTTLRERPDQVPSES